ncbi:transcription factor E2F3 [Hippocampus zosterae]|uniref:transcription factor E2F3 n=1 Tax=Hippocampus zosterae TaxID=109293 RepID=UPI00223E361D|nr:transcription factor E2F3 [Hippocampus zosterae]
MLGDAMITTEESEETTEDSKDRTCDVSSRRKQELSNAFDESLQASQAEPQSLTWLDQSFDEPAKRRDPRWQNYALVSIVYEPSTLDPPTGEEATPYHMNPHNLKRSRNDTSLVLLTRKFLSMLQQSKDGVLDLNLVTQELNSSKRRVYDVTNVLEGINLIKKIYKNHVQWLGDWLNKDTIKMMNDLSEKEKKLDELIKSCTRAIHGICVDEQTSRFAYVTYEDIQSIPFMREQTVLVIKGPEDTTLDVTHPKESLQVHLKSTRGPIDVLICSDEPLPMEVTDGDLESHAQ